jgi:hypothetical protein
MGEGPLQLSWARRLALALTLGLVSWSQAGAVETYYDREAFLGAPKEKRVAFIIGVYDAFAVLHDAGLIDDEGIAEMTSRVLVCTDQMPPADIDTIFVTWLQGHPNWPDVPASLLFFALDDFCH